MRNRFLAALALACVLVILWGLWSLGSQLTPAHGLVAVALGLALALASVSAMGSSR